MAGLGVVEVSDANFDQEVLQSEQPVMVDFWAVWCGPCKAIGPIVDSVAAAYEGKLKVAKVNVDQNGATPSRYGIRGIPALLFFKGGKVADQIVGYVPQDVIEEKVKKLRRRSRFEGLPSGRSTYCSIALRSAARCRRASRLASDSL
jgi:thioredoxin 1